jgi:hypothetical protein
VQDCHPDGVPNGGVAAILASTEVERRNTMSHDHGKAGGHETAHSNGRVSLHIANSFTSSQFILMRR